MLIEKHPDNEFAQLLMENGIEDVLVLEKRTELDILSWLRFEGNDYHDGAGFGLTENIFEAPRAQKQWLDYAQKEKITVRGCPKKGQMRYDAQKNEHIGTAFPWDEFWGTPSHLNNCLELWNLWNDRAIDEDMKAHLEKIGDVLAKGDHVSTVKNLLYLSKVVLKPEHRATWGKKCLLTLLKVQCHCYMDVRKSEMYKDASGRMLKKIFHKACGKEERGLAILEILMGSSMLYTPKDEGNKKGKRKSTGKERRGGGCGAMDLVPEEQLNRRIEVVDASVLDEGNQDQLEREVGFTDEICLSAEAAVGGLEEKDIDFEVLELAQVRSVSKDGRSLALFVLFAPFLSCPVLSRPVLCFPVLSSVAVQGQGRCTLSPGAPKGPPKGA